MVIVTHSLFDSLKDIINKKLTKSWKSLLENIGLDIQKADPTELALELTKELDASRLSSLRSTEAFKDMPPNTKRAIERGDPARSLLFHIVASPGVVEGIDADDYLTLAELEVLENFIYVANTHEPIKNGHNIISPPTLQELEEQGKRLGNKNNQLAIVVFSQEYRQGNESVHRKHADMCFSRVGIARVGSHGAAYDKKVRGFSTLIPGEKHAIRVSPIQYSAYLAVLLEPGKDANFGPLGMHEATEVSGDQKRKFWVPLHKLFQGAECLTGHNLTSVKYNAQHVNEKIKRFHEFLAKNGIDAGFLTDALNGTLNKPPFFVTKGLANISEEENDCSGLLVPIAEPLVKRTDTSFLVPPKITNDPNVEIDLYASSLQVQKINSQRQPEYRPAPEYVHIRDTANGSSSTDLNDAPNMSQRLLEPGRRAWHYSDNTADGWVSVEIQESTVTPLSKYKILPAYSLITAPDFYPMTSQYDLQLWAMRKNGRWATLPKENIYAEGGPEALSQERMIYPNLTLEDKGKAVFEAEDEIASFDTITALITLAGNRDNLVSARSSLPTFGFDQESKDEISLPQVQRHRGLPDGASGVYAPGWDITIDLKDGKTHFAAYGLGSPFPEDAKLCAALSTFWPAAAPDVTRTFMMDRPAPRSRRDIDRRTVVPMTDSEIGGGLSISGTTGWDGLSGPQLTENGKAVIYPDFFFADYTMNARDGKFSITQTAELDTKGYLDRIRLMHKVRGYLLQHRELGEFNRHYKLFSFEENGTNYYLRFAAFGAPKPITGRHRFFQATISNPFTVIIDKNLENITHTPGIQTITAPPPRPSMIVTNPR